MTNDLFNAIYDTLSGRLTKADICKKEVHQIGI